MMVSRCDAVDVDISTPSQPREIAFLKMPGKGVHRFVSSGDVAWFRELGARLLGPEVDDVEGWQWD